LAQQHFEHLIASWEQVGAEEGEQECHVTRRCPVFIARASRLAVHEVPLDTRGV